MSTQSNGGRSLGERVRELEEKGITSREDQARALEMPLRTYKRQLSKANLIERRSLREWIPWTIRAEHHSKAVAKWLRLLAMSADGRNPANRADRGKAVQWARSLVEQGLDVTYDSEAGWGTKSADTQDWYIRRLVEAAEQHITNLPQLDDLGKHTEP